MVKSLRVDYLEFNQFKAIAQFLDKSDNERLYLEVCLAFWGALRLSELHQLSPENINFETGDYTLKYTKGDKPRQGVLPLWLCARLWTWIKYNRPEVDGRTAAFNQGVAEARARLEVEASKKLKTGTASQRERYVHRELMLYIKHELASHQPRFRPVR
jgi:integrase